MWCLFAFKISSIWSTNIDRILIIFLSMNASRHNSLWEDQKLLPHVTEQEQNQCSATCIKKLVYSSIPLQRTLLRETQRGGGWRRKEKYLFLKGKATFGKNIVTQEAQIFHARADLQSLFLWTRKHFFALFHLTGSADIFVSISHSFSLFLLEKKMKKVFLFSLVRAFITCCHPAFHV